GLPKLVVHADLEHVDRVLDARGHNRGRTTDRNREIHVVAAEVHEVVFGEAGPTVAELVLDAGTDEIAETGFRRRGREHRRNACAVVDIFPNRAALDVSERAIVDQTADAAGY